MASKIKSEVWEWVAIFVALFALWPWILGFRHPIWQVALYMALVLMFIVALRKIKRFKGLIKKK